MLNTSIRYDFIVHRVNTRYPGSHTGILVSSHMDAPRRAFGRHYRGSYVTSDEAYDWYTTDSSQLTQAASEFLIQGIELDQFKDPGKVIENIYRVLFTRSRKGLSFYFPEIPLLDQTYQWFSEMLEI